MKTEFLGIKCIILRPNCTTFSKKIKFWRPIWGGILMIFLESTYRSNYNQLNCRDPNIVTRTQFRTAERRVGLKQMRHKTKRVNHKEEEANSQEREAWKKYKHPTIQCFNNPNNKIICNRNSLQTPSSNQQINSRHTKTRLIKARTSAKQFANSIS